MNGKTGAGTDQRKAENPVRRKETGITELPVLSGISGLNRPGCVPIPETEMNRFPDLFRLLRMDRAAVAGTDDL